MIPPFDIFRIDGPRSILWIEAAHELEAAKARVRELMKREPAVYMIHSQKTGNRITIKPDDEPAN